MAKNRNPSHSEDTHQFGAILSGSCLQVMPPTGFFWNILFVYLSNVAIFFYSLPTILFTSPENFKTLTPPNI